MPTTLDSRLRRAGLPSPATDGGRPRQLELPLGIKKPPTNERQDDAGKQRNRRLDSCGGLGWQRAENFRTQFVPGDLLARHILNVDGVFGRRSILVSVKPSPDMPLPNHAVMAPGKLPSQLTLRADNLDRSCERFIHVG